MRGPSERDEVESKSWLGIRVRTSEQQVTWPGTSVSTWYMSDGQAPCRAYVLHRRRYGEEKERG
jgi:hypothetical protein